MKRYERAFDAIDVEFQRTRPARPMLKDAFRNPSALITESSADHTERLFAAIREGLSPSTD